MSNEMLIEMYRQTNDNRYIDELYRKNEKMLWKIAHEFRCEIDELYIGFMESVARYKQGKAKFTTLMYICCKNSILCSRRKKRIECESLSKQTTDELTLADMIESDFDLESEFANKEFIASCLGLLNEQEKAVIKHYFWGDMTYDEIALKMGLHKNTINRTFHRAINKIKGAYYNGKI